MVLGSSEEPKGDGDIVYGADWNKASHRVFTALEQETLSVTAVTGSVSYSAERDFHIIQNIGAENVYVNFDAAATTSSYLITAGSTKLFETNATAIHSITAQNTSTIRIIGQA